MKKLLKLIAAALALVVFVGAVPAFRHRVERLLYPRKYSAQVEAWASFYDLDPLLVYA